MAQADLKALPSHKLFKLCASHFDDDQYWEEFVWRFNPCLTLSIYQAYRRFTGRVIPSEEMASDLLQETYLKILKNKCAALQRFRGETEPEAEVYLMHIGSSVTIDRLRRQHSLKRLAHIEPYDAAQEVEEIRNQRDEVIGIYTEALLQTDVIKTLERAFDGNNSISKRNIMIFLLYYRDGMTPKEIANLDFIQLTNTTVAHLLERMREMIYEELFAAK
jgi:RNA polymerase sigma factor (sigma-70 family)